MGTPTLSQYYRQTLEGNNKMGFLNLMWNPKFIKTRAGMTMTAQCAVGFLGGFFALFCCVLNGFESFLLWGAFFGSGFFLFTHVANLTQVLEARFPYLVRIHLGYICLWCVLLVIMCIWRLAYGGAFQVFDWILLFAFAFDLMFKYYRFKNPLQPAPAPAREETGAAV